MKDVDLTGYEFPRDTGFLFNGAIENMWNSIKKTDLEKKHLEDFLPIEICNPNEKSLGRQVAIWPETREEADVFKAEVDRFCRWLEELTLDKYKVLFQIIIEKGQYLWKEKPYKLWEFSREYPDLMDLYSEMGEVQRLSEAILKDYRQVDIKCPQKIFAYSLFNAFTIETTTTADKVKIAVALAISRTAFDLKSATEFIKSFEKAEACRVVKSRPHLCFVAKDTVPAAADNIVLFNQPVRRVG
ncbi:MAG: hypothetical protein GY793_03245 [Proteobacteria bacterium]|nr:hypothetical protein [Pseudomonadota bacterium]